LIVYRNRLAFWSGVAAVSLGVALHLPMYWQARDMEYHMAGMPMDGGMKLGMALIVAGLVLTAFGVVPRRSQVDLDRVAQVRVRALDNAPIRASHVTLLLVMAAAVTIDVMKPTTLAFVMPGVAAEYGLKSVGHPQGSVPVAVLPLVALTGMVLGSVGWGWLGDRIGRRASILLAGVMFIATAICGAMPSFGWNLLMCFLMGVAVGGMLPIAFALLAETIPARHRGWLMVLIGGDVAGAYLLTSFLSAELQPHFGWRIMWLIGLPTGVLLILLNRWIPESPRFLLAAGRAADAEAVMIRFGGHLVPADAATDAAAPATEPTTRRGYAYLFARPFRGMTAGIVTFGLGWGLVNNGFLLWLPTNLRQAGFDVASADGLLASSALIGFPAVFVVAALYGLWSSKWTMTIFASLTAAALAAFALIGDRIGQHPALLRTLVVVLLGGTSAILAMLTPYSSEVYPTVVRARGAGLAGMAARTGGFLGVGLVVAGIAPPSLTTAAVVGAIPTALAAVAVARYGIETRRRPLEEITLAELGSLESATPERGRDT
jgi:MFS transporter, putative metabolite:H+ symporter